MKSIIYIVLISLQSFFFAIAAEGDKSLSHVEVTAPRDSQLGIADSANEGKVNQENIESRVVYRVGETLEVVPGLIVSQHSGEGKANQFYLRGMNLDHGTDLRFSIDGTVINQRSHAHGQGWTDLNFLIPELIDEIHYKKGPYYLSEGDFSSAGAVNIKYKKKLKKKYFSLGLGGNGYLRTLFANSQTKNNKNSLYALEISKYNGPWINPDNYKKFNGVFRLSSGNISNGWSLTAMGYSGKWNSTDQIPLSAVRNRLFSRFDTVDSSNGGQTTRFSISGEMKKTRYNKFTNANFYIVQNYLNLFSNFSYFLDDPINGDQFNQKDKRFTSGFNLSQSWDISNDKREIVNTLGLQIQNDYINNGLNNTNKRNFSSTVRSDKINQTSLGIFFENHIHWNSKIRSVVGTRSDFFQFDVNSKSLKQNSGSTNDFMLSPKFSLIFGPWKNTEYYLSYGSGFHSNDARGTTIKFNPKTGLPQNNVPGLVKSNGYELGIRSEFIPGLNSSFSVFKLNLDSELLFLGDTGSTEPKGASERIGWEINNYFKLNSWITIDADIAMTKARFINENLLNQYIPGAAESVGSLSVIINREKYYGSLQLRYFGARPLTQDNLKRSNSTSSINCRLGFFIDKKSRVEIIAYNLLDSKDPSIQYFYPSRITPNAEAKSDFHFHPLEPRSLRVIMIKTF